VLGRPMRGNCEFEASLDNRLGGPKNQTKTKQYQQKYIVRYKRDEGKKEFQELKYCLKYFML
jgi:hypothetical protein